MFKKWAFWILIAGAFLLGGLALAQAGASPGVEGPCLARVAGGE